MISEIAGTNCAALNNPIYDYANKEPCRIHTDEHFQTVGHSSTWNNPTYDSANDGHSSGINT